MGLQPGEDAQHLQWMERALDLAETAASRGEVPVGALVVQQGQVIGEGVNSSLELSDPSAHAEIQALRDAGRRLGNYRLTDSTLVVTLEPCVMCVGALVHSRIGQLVFAAREPKTGAVVSCARLLDAPWHNHRTDWTEGVLAERSTKLLRDFFAARRHNSSGQA